MLLVLKNLIFNFKYNNSSLNLYLVISLRIKNVARKQVVMLNFMANVKIHNTNVLHKGIFYLNKSMNPQLLKKNNQKLEAIHLTSIKEISNGKKR